MNKINLHKLLIITSTIFFSSGLLSNTNLLTRIAKKVLHETSACAKICVTTIAAACAYGIANDQVSARVCPEYFTEGFHRRNLQRLRDGWFKRTLLNPNSPTKLGLVWGVFATWWMGAALSIPVILASRIGKKPRLGWKDLIKPASVALGFMGAVSAIAGILGYRAARSNSMQIKLPFVRIQLPNKQFWRDHIATGVPEQKLNPFIGAACAHHAAYASGALSALGMTVWAIYKRLTMRR